MSEAANGVVSVDYHTEVVRALKEDAEILSEKLERHKEALEQMTNARDFHIGEVDKINNVWRLAAGRDRARIAELESIQESDAKTINDAAREAGRMQDQIASLGREVEIGETHIASAHRHWCNLDERLREARATLASTRRALNAALRMESDQ